MQTKEEHLFGIWNKDLSRNGTLRLRFKDKMPYPQEEGTHSKSNRLFSGSSMEKVGRAFPAGERGLEGSLETCAGLVETGAWRREERIGVSAKWKVTDSKTRLVSDMVWFLVLRDHLGLQGMNGDRSKGEKGRKPQESATAVFSSKT